MNLSNGSQGFTPFLQCPLISSTVFAPWEELFPVSRSAVFLISTQQSSWEGAWEWLQTALCTQLPVPTNALAQHLATSNLLEVLVDSFLSAWIALLCRRWSRGVPYSPWGAYLSLDFRRFGCLQLSDGFKKSYDFSVIFFSSLVEEQCFFRLSIS